MNDDLDTHGALDALHYISNAINSYLTGNVNKGVVIKISGIYRILLKSLGFFEDRGTGADELTKELIEAIAIIREHLRNEKRYDLSDMIRNELAKIGVILSDTSGGTAWKIDKK
jgi:cysteinyl-tRNA synthetase